LDKKKLNLRSLFAKEAPEANVTLIEITVGGLPGNQLSSRLVRSPLDEMSIRSKTVETAEA
jgi:hypothetical protein